MCRRLIFRFGWMDAVLFYLASIQVFLFAVVNTNFDFLVHFAVTDLLYKFKDCSSYIVYTLQYNGFLRGRDMRQWKNKILSYYC